MIVDAVSITKDSKNLILSQILQTLNTMQRAGVGHVDQVDTSVNGLIYIFDNHRFKITVEDCD